MIINTEWKKSDTYGTHKNRPHPLANKQEFHSKHPSHSGVEGNITKAAKDANVSPKLLKPTFKPQG